MCKFVLQVKAKRSVVLWKENDIFKLDVNHIIVTSLEPFFEYFLTSYCTTKGTLKHSWCVWDKVCKIFNLFNSIRCFLYLGFQVSHTIANLAHKAWLPKHPLQNDKNYSSPVHIDGSFVEVHHSPSGSKEGLSYKEDLRSFNQLRGSPVTKGHYGSCLTLLLYDKDQSKLNFLWLTCKWRKIYCLVAATAYGFVCPCVPRHAVSMQRRTSLLFCNRLLWKQAVSGTPAASRRKRS